MTTLLETMKWIQVTLTNQESVVDRKQAREFTKKWAPQHLGNLNELFKLGYLKRNVLWGFDVNNKGYDYLLAEEKLPRRVNLGGGRVGTAIMDKDRRIIEWIHHPDDEKKEEK